MVNLPTNARLGIRQRSVEFDPCDYRTATISFEIFAYAEGNGSDVLSEGMRLSREVKYESKNPESNLNPDYDRMVKQAVSELKKDLQHMLEVLDRMAPVSEPQ